MRCSSAMPASAFVGDQILNCFLSGVAPSLPTRLYVALHGADPGPLGENEVSTDDWPSYLRKDASLGGSIDEAFTVAANKVSFNLKKLEYGVMDGALAVTITHFAIWDLAIGGNLYFYGPLIENKVLSPTDECLINPDKLQVTVI